MVGRLIMCFAFGACGLFAPGCDGGRPMSPVAPDDEVLTFDAAMLARDAGPASPDATRPGPRDSGVDPVDPDSGVQRPFHPDVPAVNVGHPSWDVMELQAFNIVADDIGRITEIFMVVRNRDPVLTICSISLDIDVLDGSGTRMAFIGLTFDGQPMETSLVAACVPPGGVGLGYGNASGVLDVPRVARLDMTWFGAGSETARPYGDVRNEGETIVAPYGGETFWAVEGRLRIVSGRIRNPAVTVLPLIDGLPVDQLRDITLGDFSPGQMFDYTTTAHEGRFTEYLSALDYRDPYPVVAETPEGQEALRAFERRQRVRDEGQRRRVDL
ncbi:MAG: hypothetical protein SangKO_044500 [Sandaracinaceae bacterium]